MVIGDLEHELIKGGYKKDRDFYVYDQGDCMNFAVEQLTNNIQKELLSQHHKLEHHRRYIIIVDRRNPDDRDINRDKKTWNDKLYLISK